MFRIVAEAESTGRARKPIEVSRLLIVNGGTPPHNLINASPMYIGGEIPLGVSPGSCGKKLKRNVILI